MWPDFSSPRYHRLLRPAEFYDGGNPRNASGVIVWPNKSNWLPRPSDWTHQNKIGTGLTLRDNPTYEIYPVHVKLALEIACHWKLSSIRRRRKCKQARPSMTSKKKTTHKSPFTLWKRQCKPADSSYRHIHIWWRNGLPTDVCD